MVQVVVADDSALVGVIKNIFSRGEPAAVIVRIVIGTGVLGDPAIEIGVIQNIVIHRNGVTALEGIADIDYLAGDIVQSDRNNVFSCIETTGFAGVSTISGSQGDLVDVSASGEVCGGIIRNAIVLVHDDRSVTNGQGNKFTLCKTGVDGNDEGIHIASRN